MINFNNLPKALSYDDIAIIPRVISTIEHRSECITSTMFCGQKLNLPIVASPMSDVCDGEMSKHLAENGCFGLIHRFMTIEEQVNQYTLSLRGGLACNRVGCAIGCTGDYKDRFTSLYFEGCRIFCIDVANGANIQVQNAIKWIRSFESSTISKVYIIAGNVASGECFRWLANLPIDYVRISIAVGSQCVTRYATGVYCPIVTTILECIEERNKLDKYVGIIACGSCRGPSDFTKALALGCDMVMLGSVLASTKESPSMFIKKDSVVYKAYKGAASYGAQLERGQVPKYIEGDEDLLPYTGKLNKTIQRFQEGLQSAMSYVNARTLKDFRTNVTFVRVS